MVSAIWVLVVAVFGVFLPTGICIDIHEDKGICGSKIIGGCDAAPNEFPYQARIVNQGYMCGGVILSSKFVLTAAHCVSNAKNKPEIVNVTVGDHFLSKIEKTEQITKLRSIIIHDKFEAPGISKGQFDIAVVELYTPIKIDNKTTSTMALPPATYNATGFATLTGWGSTKPSENPPQASDILKKNSVNIITDDECKKHYSSSFIIDSILCAGQEGQGSCQGDSGGPLVQNGMLVGIVSGGMRGTCATKPGIFAEVAKFSAWIREKTA